MSTTTLVEHNALGRHPKEPTTVYCRRGDLIQWLGWSEYVIDCLVEAGVLKVKRFPSPNGKAVRRLFYTAQVKQIAEEEN